jgi:hypothetical protein
MSKLRLLVVGVIAMVAVGIAATGSASAGTLGGTCESGSFWKVCVESPAGSGLKLIEGSTTIVGVKEGGASILKVTEGPEVSCEKAAATGTINNHGATENATLEKVVIKFTGNCKVLNAEAKCEAPAEIATLSLGATAPEGPSDLKFAPEGSEIFAEFTIKSKKEQTCAFAIANGKVTGTQLCVLNGAELDAVTHLLECLATGSSLKFGGKAATFNLEETIELSETGFAGLPWDYLKQT